MVNCPHCGKREEFTGNEHRPFCSERCKLIDFGSWADGDYALPAATSSLTEDDLEVIERVRLNNGND